MRHLFLPACICLVTLSSPLRSDSRSSLKQFSGANSDSEETVVRVAETTASGRDEIIEKVPFTPVESTIDIPMPRAAEKSIPLPVPRPSPKPVVSRSDREICDSLIEAAQSNQLPIPFFIHLLFQESGFKPDVVSHAGAQGIAQFMPETAATVGLNNPFDPLQAIAASARLLRNLVRQFGNLGLAAAAYNAGPRRIQDWLAKKGKLPDETQNYVKTITGRPAKTWASTVAGSPKPTVPRQAPCREAAGLVALNTPQNGAPEPHRGAAAVRSRGREMIAARGRVKFARFAAEKTPTIVADERSGRKRETGAKGAIQLAAATKKKHHKVQLSQG